MDPISAYMSGHPELTAKENDKLLELRNQALAEAKKSQLVVKPVTPVLKNSQDSYKRNESKPTPAVVYSFYGEPQKTVWA